MESAKKQDQLISDTNDESDSHVDDEFLTMGKYAVLVIVLTQFLEISNNGNFNYLSYAAKLPVVTCREHSKPISVCKINERDYKSIPNCTLKVEFTFNSVYVEFKKYCASDEDKKLDKYEEFIITITGAYFSASIGDRYGRKKLMIFTFVIVSILGFCVSIAHSITIFTRLRSVLAFLNGGLLNTCKVYPMENIPSKHRLWVSSVFSWLISSYIFDFMVSTAQDWRILQRLIIFFSLPALLLFMFVYETPSFLIQKGKFTEARSVLRRIQKLEKARENDRGNVKKILADLANADGDNDQEYSIHLLFATKELALTTIALCFGGFISEMIHRGLLFAHLYFAPPKTLFITDIISYTVTIIAGVIDYKFKIIGRKLLHFIAYSTLILSLAILVTLISTDKIALFPNIVAAIIHSLLTVENQLSLITSISTIENYPTIIRLKAVAVVHVCRKFGMFFAKDFFIFQSHVLYPYIVMIVLSIIDTVLFQLFVPETKGKPLPDSLKRATKGRKTEKRASIASRMIMWRLMT